jgi:peroxiredoxin/mono/diheme cytochrome c family protein
MLVLSSVAAGAGDGSKFERVADFELQDFRGKPHRLADYADRPVVVLAFLGTECPLARLYAPRLQELSEEFGDKVQFLGIDSNTQDSVTELASYARVHGVKFPLLKDLGNKVADQIGARRTPEVFVLDADRVVRYAGRIDDQYGGGSSTGYAQPTVKKRDLANAISDLLAGKAVQVAKTEAPGCLIGRVREVDPNSPVTYSNQIARILQKNCVECHRPGQIAPFSLTDYSEVAGWSEMIEEVVRDQRMPPWHADPKYGHFYNDRSLSDMDKEAIYAWVKAGAPEGNPSELPEPVEFTEGWQYRVPDELIYMQGDEFELLTEGTMPYKYFVVDPGWTEDRWIKSTECLIGNRAVVHHIFVFAVPPGVEIPDFKGPDSNEEEFNPGQGGVELIAGAAPGTPAWVHPEGFGTYLAAGTRLVFQMHYTPNGRENKDRSAIGFTFSKAEDVRHDASMSMAINFGFRIPAGADNHPVEAVHKFKKDTLILNLAPHMHLRGKSFKYDLEYPDGTTETILSVPRYDFNWQMIYMLQEPKFVPAGTTMRCLAHFDNSPQNLANPDPDSEVRWGDQTWEEMCIGWFLQTTDIDPQMVPADQQRTARFVAEVANKPLKVTGLLKKAAGTSLESSDSFEKFARRLSAVLPQLDRVCLAVTDGETVRIENVFQPSVFLSVLGGAGRQFDAKSSALAKYARGQQVVQNTQLAGSELEDLALMANRLGSSVHYPVMVGGKPGVLSFWSKEPAAFPEAAKTLLDELAGLANHVGNATARLQPAAAK